MRSHAAFPVLAASYHEAVGRAHEINRELAAPKGDGWGQHEVAVSLTVVDELPAPDEAGQVHYSFHKK